MFFQKQEPSVPDCTAASHKCRKVLQVSSPSAEGWPLVCWQGLLESAKRGTKEHWDNLVFKEGCKLVFWLNRKMMLKQDQTSLSWDTIPGWQTLPLEGSPALLSFRVMAFLGAVCPAGDNSLPLYTLLHVPWWCDILWLVYLFPCPPLLLLCMLGIRNSCMGTNAANLFLHMNVAGQPGFWINHNLFCTLCAFELVGTGMVWGGLNVVFVWLCLLVFFLIWSKEAETCLKVFQLPIFLFDITCPSILCQLPQRKQEAFPVCFWSNQLPEPKDHGEHPFFAVKTRWYRGTNSTCFFLLLWPSKTNHTFKNSVKSGPNSSSRLLQLAWLQGDLKSLKLFVGRC